MILYAQTFSNIIEKAIVIYGSNVKRSRSATSKLFIKQTQNSTGKKLINKGHNKKDDED